MKKSEIIYIIFALILLIFAACQNQNQVSEQIQEKEMHEETNDIEDGLAIKEGGILGIRSGSFIQEFQALGKLTKGEIDLGDDYIEGWYIIEKSLGPIGYVVEHPEDQGSVGNIYITSPEVLGLEGIHIGSTWRELQEAWPGISIGYSGNEHSLTARIGIYNYRLNSPNTQKYTDASQIDPDTKIDLIWIEHDGPEEIFTSSAMVE